MLNTVSRYSIWELGHRWHNLDPESTDSKKLPLVVQDTLRSLAGAYHYDDLMIVNSKGVENKGAYHEPTQHRYKHEEIEEGLADCNQRKIFDKPLLESVYIEQQPLGKWCLEKGIALPDFWFSAGWKPDSSYSGWQSDSSQPETKLRSLQIDKLVCQAIARTLWDSSPQMTIADMCKHEAVQRYGNGRLYKGEHTLRDWLSEVAPPEVKGKRGRPKKSET
ncbi:hypothetical protein SAMN05216315_1088 [Nitrosospira sp. Nsp18]|uniref:hypothetical protein n=1 Tax=Nitrosospira sp. Nsp18 TaxID=1855334 RepID=UPI00088B89FD|nr:hypothetical protein [Nitrosospira sp. Nsp18]SDA16518.1 hypothetical protein SAMN05216315_1088 [Nitrosospira sp. Nsp18]